MFKGFWAIFSMGARDLTARDPVRLETIRLAASRKKSKALDEKQLIFRQIDNSSSMWISIG